MESPQTIAELGRSIKLLPGWTITQEYLVECVKRADGSNESSMAEELLMHRANLNKLNK